MRALTRQLFVAALLLFSVLFKGVGGYTDLYWYLEDSVHLWTRGSFELTVAEAAGTAGARYHRFAPGLPIVSGPFVLAGELLHRLDSRIPVEFIITLIIPLAAASAVVLLFKILVRLGATPTDALWSVAIFAFGSPFLSFTRMYYVEIVIIVFLYLAIWFWLKTQDPAAQESSPRTRSYWAICGVALTGVMACHYVCFMTALGLLIAWTFAEFTRNTEPKRKFTAIGLLCLPLLLGGLLLLFQNYLRYGHAFTTGYNLEYGATQIFTLSAIPGNLVELLKLFARTPWAVPAIVAVILLHKTQPTLAKGIVLAWILQHAAWLTFVEFSRFSTRYDLPALALAALMLPRIAVWLRTRFPNRGLTYTAMALILYNLALVLRGDDWSPPFQIEDAGISALLWYRMHRYIGAFEWAILLALLIGGTVLFSRAARNARNLSESKPA